MHIQLVFLAFFQSILAEPVQKPSYDVSNDDVIGHHFEKFIKEHNRQYDEIEKAIRLQIFVENLKEINTLNQKYSLSTYDIGKFADMSQAERRSFLGYKASDNHGLCKVLGDLSTKDAPAAWDWRDKDAVSPVKNQKSCGSCWAFSATALIESRYWQIGKKLILSEQQMMDCDKTGSNCVDGGEECLGVSEIIEYGGQESEDDYPYEAKYDKCRFDKTKVVAKVSNCSIYSLSSEDALKELLYKEGPLSIAVDPMHWFNFKSGIYDNCGCVKLDHAVLLVGYGRGCLLLY